MIKVINEDMVVALRNYPPQYFNLIYYDPPQEINYNRQDRYVYNLSECLDTVIPRLAENSRLVIFTSLKNRFVHEYYMYKRGYHIHEEIIWYYDFGLYTRKYFVRSHNTILVYKFGQPPFNWLDVAIKSQRLKAGDLRGDVRGRTPGDVWEIPRLPGNSSERRIIDDNIGLGRSQHPKELVRRIIKAYTNTGDWVLDPFAGSGIVLEQCRNFNRNCIGIEINPYFAHQIQQRLTIEHETARIRDIFKV